MNPRTQTNALTPYEAVLGKAKQEIEAYTQSQEYRDLRDDARQRKIADIQQRADTEAARLAEQDITQAVKAVEMARSTLQSARMEARLSTNYLGQLLSNDVVRTKATYAREVADIDAELAEAIESVDVETITAWHLVGLPILLGKAHEHGIRSDWAERYPAWAQRLTQAASAIEPEALATARENYAAALSKQEAIRRSISSAAHYSGRNGYGSVGPLSQVAAKLPGATRGIADADLGGVVMPASYVGQYGVQ